MSNSGNTNFDIEVTAERIQSGSVTVGEITNESMREAFENMSPAAKSQWDQLGRRLALMTEYDNRHPILSKMHWMPILWGIYTKIRLSFVLSKELDAPIINQP